MVYASINTTGGIDMAYKRLAGLIAAPFTAFHADGSLNLEPIEDYAAMLCANGVSGVFICGTTGEGSSLTTAERMQVAERWVSAADSKLRIIVHVGHASLPECQTLAANAQSISADGFSCLAPYFFKPLAEELVQFCAEVAGAAPALPFYYYHIPSMTGVNLAMLDFLKLASSRIPNLQGVKFTYENLMDFGQCLRLEDRRFDIVFGRDEILLSGLAIGASAAIGSTYNFAAPVYTRLISDFAELNLPSAREHQAKACEMIAVFLKHGGLPAGKAMMKLIGLDCGPVRLPLRNLTAPQIDALGGDLEQIGFFDYCCKMK